MFLIEELNGRDYRIDVVSEVCSPLAVLFLLFFFIFHPSTIFLLLSLLYSGLFLWFVWFEKFYAQKSKICMVDTFFGLIHNNYLHHKNNLLCSLPSVFPAILINLFFSLSFTVFLSFSFQAKKLCGNFEDNSSSFDPNKSDIVAELISILLKVCIKLDD